MSLRVISFNFFEYIHDFLHPSGFFSTHKTYIILDVLIKFVFDLLLDPFLNPFNGETRW